MISFPANVDIFVVHTPVSFSCGIDGMIRYCCIILKKEPLSRAYFLFINKRKEQLRALWFDGQGFLLCTKRLSSGRYKYWPINDEGLCSQFPFFDAHILFSGGDFLSAKAEKIWKKVS